MMTYRLRYRIKQDKDDQLQFKMLIGHPMETGYRRDKATGKKIAANYIEKFRVDVDDKNLIEMILGPNISKNPFFGFIVVEPIYTGQLVVVTWFDNLANEVSFESVVDFDQTGTHRFSGSYINS